MMSKTGATDRPEEPQTDQAPRDAEEFTKQSSERVVEKRLENDKDKTKKA